MPWSTVVRGRHATGSRSIGGSVHGGVAETGVAETGVADRASSDDRRFRPQGGAIGASLGLSVIIVARLTAAVFGSMTSRPGSDDGAATLGVAATVLIVVAVPLAVRRMVSASSGGRGEVAMLSLVAAMIGSAGVCVHEAAVRSLRPDIGGVAPIIEVRGRLSGPPTLDPEASGPGGAAAWRSTVQVVAADHPGLLGRELSVSWPGDDARLRTGVEVSLTGRLSVVPPPLDPGERDRRRGSRDRVPARLVVPSPALVEVECDVGLGPRAIIESVRGAWRRSAQVLDAAIAARDPSTSGIVAAVLTGDRSRVRPRARDWAEDAGLAPLLAISGWHIALVGALSAGLLGRHRPVGRAVSIAMVALFAVVVVPGPSVRRAATMAIVGGLLVLTGRRPRGLPLLGVAAGLVVWVDPSIVESIGFALSVTATAALILGTGPSRRRWFGASDRIGRRRRSIGREPIAAATTASIIAWTVSSPMVLATFGRLSLVAVPSMVVMGPMFAVLLVSAIGSTLVVAVVGGAPAPIIVVVGTVVSAFTCCLERIAATAPIVRAVWPMWVGLPAFVAAGCLAMSFARSTIVMRWGLRGVAMLVMGGALVVARGGSPKVAIGTLRVDAIAVGDGTAMLVRGRDAAVLVDAGSSSVERVGRRIVVPALRSLGVRRLDAIVVTHANLDHFNAVADVVRAVPVDAVVVSPPLLDEARRLPESPIGRWLLDLHASGVAVVETSRGDRLRFGGLAWRVLHPTAGEACRSANDASIVAAVGLVGDPDRTTRLLVCGDIQDEAIARVLSREPALSAIVMELPHHGSWRPLAVTLLDHVDPEAIVQSTGPDRWWLDRWRDACGARRRGITCRDGRVSFEVDFSGRVRSDEGSFRRTADLPRDGRPESDRRTATRPP